MEIFIISYVLLFLGFIIISCDYSKYKKKAEKLEIESELYKEKYHHIKYIYDEKVSENIDMFGNIVSLNVEIDNLNKKLKGKGKK